jgi:hypothetical protein
MLRRILIACLGVMTIAAIGNPTAAPAAQSLPPRRR